MRDSDTQNLTTNEFVFSGVGMHITCRCDECQRDGVTSRTRAKVKAGPLRGLFGMVCKPCLEKRRPQ